MAAAHTHTHFSSALLKPRSSLPALPVCRSGWRSAQRVVHAGRRLQGLVYPGKGAGALPHSSQAIRWRSRSRRTASTPPSTSSTSPLSAASSSPGPLNFSSHSNLEASTHFSIIFAFVMFNLRFPNPPGQLVQPLSTICDPYLNLFRGIVPPIGQIDLSPILAFVVLNAAQSTAAALPREMQSRRKGGGGRGMKVSV